MIKFIIPHLIDRQIKKNMICFSTMSKNTNTNGLMNAQDTLVRMVTGGASDENISNEISIYQQNSESFVIFKGYDPSKLKLCEKLFLIFCERRWIRCGIWFD